MAARIRAPREKTQNMASPALDARPEGKVFGMSPVIAAVAMMLMGGLMSSLLHIGVRYVSPHIPTFEIVTLRSMFTIFVSLPFVLRPGQGAWRSNNLPLQLTRGLVGVCSMSSWYYALGKMPLADAGALSFTTAIFVTVGAALWFGEPVGPRRWSAVIVGLLGALIVLNPGSGVLSWAAILAVGSSALWAVSLLMSKLLARYDSVATITFYQPLTIMPLALLGAVPVWVWPSTEVWLCLMGMGVAAAIGNYGYIKALRIADVAISMPADYLRLLWMASWGYWLFGEVPGLSTWLGAALIIGAAFFITIREQQLASARVRAMSAARAAKETIK
jgi:drug/metabolite transporter (DMT)-like permease